MPFEIWFTIYTRIKLKIFPVLINYDNDYMLTVIKFPYLKFTLVPNVRTWCHLFQVYRDLLGFATKQESTLAQPKVNSKKIHIRKWESNGIHICNTLCKRIYMVRCMTYKLQIYCNFIIALTIPCERIILLNYKFVRPLFFFKFLTLMSNIFLISHSN